jgi:hypothetical protein
MRLDSGGPAVTLDVFEPLTFHARRSGRCPCGRTTERAKTFHDAVNPLHVDPDTGRPKTRDQVLADLAAEAAQWVPDFYCRSHSWVPVVIDIERFGDDWRDLYRVGPAHGSRRGAERAGREMVSPGRRLSPGVEPGFLLAMVDAGVLLAVLNAAGEPVSWAGRYWAEFAQGCGWTLPEESRC